MTTTNAITAEQLFQMDLDAPCELLRGELRMMTPAGGLHGRIAGNAYFALRTHVEQHGAGVLYAAETGFVLAREPDTVRAPDVAWLSAERGGEETPAFIEGPPDLAVEVVSPRDSRAKVTEKAKDWLDAGTRLLWVVWPKTRTVSVHEPGRDVRTLGEGDILDAGDLLPDFQCPVERLFA